MTDILALIIASTACIISLLLLIERFSWHKKDTRPYLSFKKTNGIVKIDESNGIAGIYINLEFENVGKCVLRYNIIKFDIFINGLKLPDVALKSTGSVLGVKVSGSFNKYYTNLLKYKLGLASSEYIPPNHVINFEVEYYKIGRPNKKYKLAYEVHKEFERGISREYYGETFAN